MASDTASSILEPLLENQDPQLNAAIKTAREIAPQMVQTSFEGGFNYQGLQLGSNSGAMTNNFGASR